MTHHRGMGQIPAIAPIPDPWYQQKARDLQAVAAASMAGLGQSTGDPPPRGQLNVALMVGWGAVVLAAGGIFWFTTRQGRSIAANPRRRRSSRRRSSRRRSSRRRRVSRNARKGQGLRRNSRQTQRGTKRRSTARSRVSSALSQARRQGASLSRAGLNQRIAASLSRRAPGLYRVGKGKVTKYKSSTSLQGAMTSTRIAASASGETHWLVKVYASGSPKLVVVRKIDPKGRSSYRVEESWAESGKREDRQRLRANVEPETWSQARVTAIWMKRAGTSYADAKDRIQKKYGLSEQEMKALARSVWGVKENSGRR